MGHGDIDDRDVDVRVRFLRDIDIGISPGDKDQQQGGDDRPGPADCRINDGVHWDASAT